MNILFNMKSQIEKDSFNSYALFPFLKETVIWHLNTSIKMLKVCLSVCPRQSDSSPRNLV